MSARETLIETSKPAAGVTLRGESLLTINKGTSFTHRERKEFDLTGRLPSRVNTLDEQVSRAYEQLSSRHDPIRKNTFFSEGSQLGAVLCTCLKKLKGACAYHIYPDSGKVFWSNLLSAPSMSRVLLLFGASS